MYIRDVREWLLTFPFPPIPNYSIPIPPMIPIPNSVFYSNSHAGPENGFEKNLGFLG